MNSADQPEVITPWPKGAPGSEDWHQQEREIVPGFGMRKQGLPADHWIDRFGEWLQVQGFMHAPQPLK
jgi:hypothetical protein